jgi:2-polyprenyl-3-methyl-5-hydroxy-6-metoxy-1,4-benzoquinol methylase
MSKSFFEERKNCPSCGAKETTVCYQAKYSDQAIKQYLIEFYSPQGGIEFDYLHNEEYILCKCKSCGLIFQKNIPNDFLMERLYEHWIDPIKAFENRNSRFKVNPEIYANYAKEILTIGSCFKKSPSDIRLLDFGMGWGDWLLMANGLGYESYGLELSTSRIKHAESKGINVISWEQAEGLRFEFINTEQVFEHISEPLETLKELKTLLKPGGIIKISVPTANDIERRLKLMDWGAKKGTRNSLNNVAPLEHIQCFNRLSLIKMAEAAGMKEFKISLIKQWNNSYGWLNLKGFARNLVIPIYRNILKRQNYIFLTPK